MVRFLLPAAIWMIALGVGQAGEQQFPYVAYVTEAGAYARSGPGQKYYPTQRLPEGFAVEVYRHDGEGWCAVRPPEGSFSWIPAHQVRVVSQAASQAVGEVAAEGVVTRIGSTLSPARSTVQVLLPKGERVAIFAGQATNTPGWLRVAAPAGEFRWVAAKHLSLQPPIEATPAVSPSTGWAKNSPQNVVQGMAAKQPNAEFQHLQDSGAGRQGSNAFQPPTRTSEAANFRAFPSEALASNDPSAIDVVAGSPAEMQLAQFQPETASSVSPALLGQPTTASAVPSDPFPSSPRIRFRRLSAADGTTAQRLEELQLRLSQTVLQQPAEWRFDQIESEAKGLLEKTGSPKVRSQLRDVLDRIARFQRVRLGYLGAAMAPSKAVPHNVAPRNALVADVAKSTKPAGESLTGLVSKVRELAKVDLAASNIATSTRETLGQAVDKPLYDAVGLLKPVTSKRAKAPQYALVDDRGEVVSFVTPRPDLNLQPYLGHRIGVHGKRGFMPEYRRAHVTAERVSMIADRVRR